MKFNWYVFIYKLLFELFNKAISNSVNHSSRFSLRIIVANKGKKVKLSLCLTKNHAMKAYWGSGGIASRPGRFTPRERAPGTHWIGGWVGSRAVLDAVVKRKISAFIANCNINIK
jgi:hypothetical protein